MLLDFTGGACHILPCMYHSSKFLMGSAIVFRTDVIKDIERKKIKRLFHKNCPPCRIYMDGVSKMVH